MFKKCMIVLAAALCVVSLTACGNQKAEAQQQTAQAEAVADLKIGAPAPDIDLPAADGKSVKLSQLYAQGPVFINFWASWCPPCVGECRTYKRLMMHINRNSIYCREYGPEKR